MQHGQTERQKGDQPLLRGEGMGGLREIVTRLRGFFRGLKNVLYLTLVMDAQL